MYWWLAFNMNDPILGKNLKLRQSIAHAVNIEKFIKLFTSNVGLRANSIYPPGVPGYDPSAELPFTYNVEKAKELIKEAGVKAQVGHVERFNPAYLAVKDFAINPMFIETHRLAQFNPRGTDVSVVLDLMIHDIDIILKMVGKDVKHIAASGVPIISDSPDIANARIEFVNGAVANVTSSRISMKNMRKTRVFQRDAYISIDFLEKETQIFKLYNEQPSHLNTFEVELGEGKNNKYIHFDTPTILPTNAIQMELELFGESILNQTETAVTALDGLKAMEVAYGILDKIQKMNVI